MLLLLRLIICVVVSKVWFYNDGYFNREEYVQRCILDLRCSINSILSNHSGYNNSVSPSMARKIFVSHNLCDASYDIYDITYDG